MKYIPPELPITDPPNKLTRAQAKQWFDWYRMQIPTRLQILSRAVKSASLYANWENDKTPESLAMLGAWFVDNVEIRKRTASERERIYSSAPDWFRQVEIEDWDLTGISLYKAFDMGIYFGEVIKASFTDIDWQLKTNAPTSIDYHMPVLRRKGSLDCSPINLMINYAYGIARKAKNAERLQELFEFWVDVLGNPR